MCEWLLASGCPLKPAAVCVAALSGREGLMQWLLQLLRQRNGAAEGDLQIYMPAAASGLGLAALQRLHHQQQQEQQEQQRQPEEQQQQPQPQPGGGEAQQQQPAPNQAQLGQVLHAAASSPTPDWRAKVEWLEGLGYPRTADACKNAAGVGPGRDAVGRLRGLHARGYPMSADAVEMAASENDLAAVRFLVEQAGVVPRWGATEAAVVQGHLAVLQYFHAIGHRLNAPRAARTAAQVGQQPVLVWAVEVLGATPDNAPNLLDAGATSGSVELMTWLRERGWGWGAAAVTNAAESGCEEALEWLVERGCPLPVDGRPYLEPARRGDLAVIRALHRLGCLWGGPGQALLVDCVRGDEPAPVPALRLLVELGCPADWEALQAEAEALQPGDYRTALLEWLGDEAHRRTQSGA